MSQEDEHALIKQKRGLIFGDSRSYWQQAYLISLDMMHMKNFWKIFLLYLKKKRLHPLHETHFKGCPFKDFFRRMVLGVKK